MCTYCTPIVHVLWTCCRPGEATRICVVALSLREWSTTVSTPTRVRHYPRANTSATNAPQHGNGAGAMPAKGNRTVIYSRSHGGSLTPVFLSQLFDFGIISPFRSAAVMPKLYPVASF